MFTMRSRRISPKLFILPMILIAFFGAVAVFDYNKQHVHVNMLGETFDVSSIQQILVEQPSTMVAQSHKSYFQLTSQASILKLCNLLATAKPYTGNEGDFATDIDSMLLEVSGSTIQIPIAQTSTNVVLLFMNEQAYIAPHDFLNRLETLAQQGQV